MACCSCGIHDELSSGGQCVALARFGAIVQKLEISETSVVADACSRNRSRSEVAVDWFTRYSKGVLRRMHKPVWQLNYSGHLGVAGNQPDQSV